MTTIAARLLRHPTDWLAAVLISWIIPLELLGFPSTYFTSLTFWVVPVILLLPRLYHETDAGGRRRRAFWITTGFIVVAGVLLDFVFGEWILAFDDVDKHQYVWRFPFGQHIPIEEVLFYILGGMAIVLVPPFGTLPLRPYPIEALLVWLAVSFDTIFAYEFLKGITYDQRTAREAMFGNRQEKGES